MIDLVTRRAYFDDYADTIERLPPSLVQYGVRFSCPCCGYPTLNRRGLDGICHLCSWEDDGQDDHDADDVRRGPNNQWSLTRARDNFVTYGVMYEPELDRRIGGPDSPEVRRIKGEIIAAFDEMQRTPMDDHERLWATVHAGDRELYRILLRSIG